MVRGTATGSSPRGWADSGVAATIAKAPRIKQSFMRINFAPRLRRIPRVDLLTKLLATALGCAGLNACCVAEGICAPEPSAVVFPNRPFRVPGLPSFECADGRGATRSGSGMPSSSSSSRRISSRRRRGFLELEVGGGLAHPLLEVADVGAEVVADEVRPLLVAGVDQHAVAQA